MWSLFLISLFIVPIFIALLEIHYSYWLRKGIPYEWPHYIVGNMYGIGRLYHWKDINKRLYLKFKTVGPVVGIYTFLTRAVLITDLDLVKEILIRNFEIFKNRNLFHNERDDPLTGNLLFLDGDAWRVLRHKLSPVFTSSKMKIMFSTMVRAAMQIPQACEKVFQQDSSILEIKDMCARYTTDVISGCAFGLNCNSVINPEAEFRRMGKSIFENPRHTGVVQAFMFTNPALARKLRMKTFRDEVRDFFTTAIKETLEQRERDDIKNDDFLDVLLEMKKQRDDLIREGHEVEENDLRSGLTMPQLAAQALMFFLAGFETSATTMSFCLYELALNQDVQENLRKEIMDNLKDNNNKITYEGIKQMKYLDMVISETLRKYSITPHLVRQCVENFQVPNTNIVLKKGLRIIIPIDSIHNDPLYYPDPDEFIPERFLADEIRQRHSCAYLPFGDGPRNCIGMRFGKMQIQIGLIILLSHFKLERCSETKIPLPISKKNFLISAEGGIYLKIKKIKKFKKQLSFNELVEEVTFL